MKYILTLVLFSLLIACSSSKNAITKSSTTAQNSNLLVINSVSEDPTYGYTPENAVKVGGGYSSGVDNEYKYLSQLVGPQGEALSYYRAGSCCPQKSENGFNGMAIIDRYLVTWQGASDTLSVYINMYDTEKLYAPKGFTHQ